MSTSIKIYLLKDFSILGENGSIVEVDLKYARNYLFPKKIAREATLSDIVEKKRSISIGKKENKLTLKGRGNLDKYLKNHSLSDTRGRFIEKVPDFSNFFRNHESSREKFSWRWYEANRLSLLPYGPKYVTIKYRKNEYLATYTYLKALISRKTKSPIIVDGSNLGWYNGYPSLDSVFSLFGYLAVESNQFFFPIIWVFDNSFRRKLTEGEKRSFDEFKRWSGVKIVDYADKEIFRLAKIFGTKYLFSNDHFKEYHTDGFVRISMR